MLDKSKSPTSLISDFFLLSEVAWKEEPLTAPATYNLLEGVVVPIPTFPLLTAAKITLPEFVSTCQ